MEKNLEKVKEELVAAFLNLAVNGKAYEQQFSKLLDQHAVAFARACVPEKKVFEPVKESDIGKYSNEEMVAKLHGASKLMGWNEAVDLMEANLFRLSSKGE